MEAMLKVMEVLELKVDGVKGMLERADDGLFTASVDNVGGVGDGVILHWGGVGPVGLMPGFSLLLRKRPDHSKTVG